MRSSVHRVRACRSCLAFSLLEVVLALAILSAALSTLLIARNRSIVQLHTSSEQVTLRAAAADALGREVLATRFPNDAGSSESQTGDIAIAVNRSTEQRTDRAVLHHIEVTAHYRSRPDVQAFTLSTAVVTSIPEEQDEQPADAKAREQR